MTLESLLYVCTRTLFDERGGVGFAPSLIAEEGYIGSALFLLLLLLVEMYDIVYSVVLRSIKGRSDNTKGSLLGLLTSL
jgi:hypothetical protein